MIVALKSEKRSTCLPVRARKARQFYLGHGVTRHASLSVVSGGHEVCAPGGSCARECPACYSVKFIARGRGALTFGGKYHPLRAGTVFSCSPAPSPHFTDVYDALEMYWVDFTGPAAPQILDDNGLSPGAVAQVSAVSEVEEIFDNLIRDGSRGSDASTSLCMALLEYLLIKIADVSVLPGTPPSAACATFHRCRQYIARHFRRLRSLEQIAEECQIDQAYLCRLFRRFGHQTPYHHLLRLKMRHAAEELRDTRKLVKEVAASLGFDDPFQFSHTFKNILGTSPDVFRRLQSARI